MALLSARLKKGKLKAERLKFIGLDVTPPTVPTGLAANVQPGGIVLTWNAAADYYGVKEYWIYRCTGATCTDLRQIAAVPGTVLTYTDTTAKPSSVYRYAVRAVDYMGLGSGFSAIVTAAETAPALAAWIYIGGAWQNISAYMRVEGATVTQNLNEVTDTASFTLHKTIPYTLAQIKGAKIQLNDHLGGAYYVGYVTAVRTIYEGKGANIAYECDCLDYTWPLNAKKVTKRYTGQFVSSIIGDIVATYAPQFTVDVSGLTYNPTLEEITFTNEEISQAISRTVERAGAYFDVTYAGVIKVFNSGAVQSAGTIDQVNARQSAHLAKHEDYVPVVTQVYARGGGAGAASDAAVGQDTLPIEDATWYDAASGGLVECGPQRLSYTGVVGAGETGSVIGGMQSPGIVGGGSPWGTFQFGLLYNSSWAWAPGRYYIAITNMNSGGGETTPWQTYFDLPSDGSNAIAVYPKTKPADPALVNFRVYCTSSPNDSALTTQGNVWGSDPKNNVIPWALMDNPPGSNYVTIGSVANIGARGPKPPTVNTAGESNVPIPPGSTSILVAELSYFPTSGWAEGPGGQFIRYTGKSAASGPGYLTGIPASGPGAITAQMRSGTIKSTPHLVGIPTSGAGSILYPIKKGDEVFIFLIRQDSAAIAALAAATGTDGIRQELLTDGRLGLKELQARADALLAFRKDPLVTVTFDSRDPGIVAGKTITINTTQPPISGTFLLLRVTIADFPAKGSIGHPLPLRTVEASSRRYTFDDLVEQIKLLGRIN